MYLTKMERCGSSAFLRTAAILGFAFFVFFAQAASAQGPLNYFKNYFVTGDYLVGGVGLAGTKTTTPVTGALAVTGSITLNSVPCTSGPGLLASVVPCTAKGAVPADVIAAFLYWQTIESTTTPSAALGSYAGSYNVNSPVNPFVGLALGNPTIAACAANGGGTGSEYVHNYRADVLKYLPINATANVRVANGTQTFTLVSGNTATQFVGATLVVVYRLVTPGNPRIAPLRSVVIYDGAFTGSAPSGASTVLNQTMGGFYQAAKTPAAHMTQIVGNGKSISKGSKEAQTLMVNGGIPQGVPADPFVGAEGANWDNYAYNISLAANASSLETQVSLTDDCLSWAAIITSTNVQDSDFDGLLDIWETSGLYLDPGTRYDGTKTTPVPAAFGTCLAPPPGARTTCLNLPAMGASPSVPDIFMQIDWMQYTGTEVPAHTHNPQLAALNMVGAVFKAHGINLHFDVGGSSTYQGQGSPYIIPAAYAQGGNVINESGNLLCPNSVVTEASNCAFNAVGPPPVNVPQSDAYSLLGWKSGFDAIKNGDSVLGFNTPLFATDRKDTFHYALFGHGLAATTPLSIEESPDSSTCAQTNSCYAGSISGVADLPGGDLMVTLGLWRSDVASVDQVGTELEQAGTLMHELGHNLDLHHGGWNNTPVCMPNYPSVMNYLYQVNGLTDSAGNEHLDYSYGLELPMSEDLLSSSFPMGVQQYRVRYFGPYNKAIDTPGQASQVSCNGQLPNTFTTQEGQYVLLQGSSVSTPDWSNGTVPLGKIITSGLDINYDGIIGETFFDQPDWISLNLQQVGARPNANGLSLNVGVSDIGVSDIGVSDIGVSDIGVSDIGVSDIGVSDIGVSDIGTAQLGQDALGDEDFATYVLSGSLSPPTNLMAAVYPSSGAGTGNILNWTGNSGVASQYNIYRCNGSSGACAPGGTPLASVSSGSPVTPTYTDVVNDFVDAGANCPATSTCYNTTYYYYVTEVNAVAGLSTETSASNTVNSEVTHMFVVANSQAVTYGTANPTPTFTVYSNVAAANYSSAALATLLPGVSCVYSPAPSTNADGYYDAGNYPIVCNNGPTFVAGTTEGVTYYTASSPALNYPSNLTGTATQFTQGSLTVNQLPITVTATCSTKVYNASTADGATCTAPSSTPAIPTITTNSLVAGDTNGFTESYDNQNAGSTHVMAPAGMVNDNNGGKNYAVTFVNSAATSVITPAPASVTPNANQKVYGQSDPSPLTTGTLTGFFAVDGVTATYSRIAGETVMGSPYTISATLSPASALTNYTITYNTANFTIIKATTTTSISSVSSSPAYVTQPVTVSVSVAPQYTGTPTGSVTIGSTAANPTSCNATFASGTWSCTLTFATSGAEMITASYSGDSNFVNSAAPNVPETVNPALTSITVAPAPYTYLGDTVTVDYDYPQPGEVLYSSPSAQVTQPAGASFSLSNGAIAVGVTSTATGSTITVSFPNGWTFNPNSVNFQGLVITDPVANVNVTGVTLGSTTIGSYGTVSGTLGYQGSSSQISFDANDIYINFPPGFPALPSGSSITLNVTFAGLTTIPVPVSEQFVATGLYSDGSQLNLTSAVAWGSSSTGTATISAGGLVTAVSQNASPISITAGASTYPGSGVPVQGSTPITVASPALVSIAVTPASTSINGTSQQQFTATGTYTDGSMVTPLNGLTWYSSNTGVATINSSGEATGVSSGSTIISATSALSPQGQLSGATSLQDVGVSLSSLVLNGTNYSTNEAAPPTIVQVNSQPALQLTNGVGDTTVSAWSPGTMPVSSAFTTTFQFKITAGAGSLADGFAFVIQGAPTGTSTLGATGYGMYIGYDGIPNSLAVEFDTYYNSQYEDPVSPHIAIQSLGPSPNTPDHTPATGANLGGGPVVATFADGNVHTATVTYDGNVTLQVQLDNAAIITATLPYPLATMLNLTGGNAYVGFTASTGGGSENTLITSWNWTAGYTGIQQPAGVLAFDDFFVPPYSLGTLVGQSASGYGFTGNWTTLGLTQDLAVTASGVISRTNNNGTNAGDYATFASPISLSSGQLFISYNISNPSGPSLTSTRLDLNLDNPPVPGDRALLGASGSVGSNFNFITESGLGAATAQTNIASTGTHHLIGVLDITNQQIAIFVDPTAASYYTAGGNNNANAVVTGWMPAASLSFPTYSLVENEGDQVNFGNVIFATSPTAVGLSATAP